MSESTKKFPKVQGGGSLIVAWQVKEKNVLVVGGGQVSSSLPPSVTSSTPNILLSSSFLKPPHPLIYC